jgi:non-ribosomal peptide synthase protein (TIGR01720 family)
LQGRRTHLLEINCHISASQFRMAWTYSEHIHLRSTIEHLATAFTHALRSIIQHCQSPESGGYTPSDFPNVELSQEELEQIIIEMDH